MFPVLRWPEVWSWLYYIKKACLLTRFCKICIVRAHDLDFTDVALDDGLVEADRLDKEQLETFFNNNFFVQFSSTLFCRVCRIEHGDFTFLVLQVVENVIQTFLTDLNRKVPLTQTFLNLQFTKIGASCAIANKWILLHHSDLKQTTARNLTAHFVARLCNKFKQEPVAVLGVILQIQVAIMP